jgi:sigma-B regulation protein RsbU (phosphoserine phosphatase)
MAVLVRIQETHNGPWVFPLGNRCLLGRSPECDLSELFADVNGVSRLHAQIERAGDQYFIEDRGSRNGTLVNGKRVTGKTPLASGERISICNIELTFYEDAAAAEAQAMGVVLDDEGSERRSLASVPVAPPKSSVPVGYTGEKMRALVQMLKRLGGSLDVTATLHELLSGLFAIFRQADRGFVAFTAPESPPVALRATLFRRPNPEARLALSRTLINHVLARSEAVLWMEHSTTPGLNNLASLEDLEVRCVMCAPLLDVEGQPFGVVQIDSNDPKLAFTKDDLEVMVAAVSQAAVAVRYARLHEEGLSQRAMEWDLQLARQVQLNLLPAEYPDCAGYEFFTYYETAYQVGGDYYDFVELPHGRLALVLADVAGKGVSAALLMAKLSGELKYYLSCEAPPLAVARLNESLCRNAVGRFVTLLLAVVETTSPRLTLINAGHPAPFRRRRSGDVEAIGDDLRGIALGILPGREWRQLETEVEPGDVWFGFTDGFTEAVQAGGEMYGVDRLQRQLARAPGAVREAGEHILKDVRQFRGDQAQSDDMCLLGWGRPDTTVAARPDPLLAAEGARTTGGLT